MSSLEAMNKIHKRLILEREELKKHLSEAVNYIEQLENSIERLDLDCVYDDMPETDFEFYEAIAILKGYHDETNN